MGHCRIIDEAPYINDENYTQVILIETNVITFKHKSFNQLINANSALVFLWDKNYPKILEKYVAIGVTRSNKSKEQTIEISSVYDMKF